MPPLQIVIDTNVIISALRSRRGPSFRCFPHWAILDGRPTFPPRSSSNTRKKLLEMRGSLGLTPEDIATVHDMLARRCGHRVIYFHWRPRSRDPDDDFSRRPCRQRM
ncbi:MAG: hypothetical protein WDN28_16635 [Chthoniobacter sp.]